MSTGSVEVSDEDKRLHRVAEKSLKEVRIAFSLHICRQYLFCSDHYVLPGKAKDGLTGQGT
jgi:hypothetical protein